MTKISLFIAAASVAGVFSVSRSAHALGPIEIEVAGKVGAATNPTGQLPNPLGFGLGGRGGVSFLGIYAGVNFVYYFGGSTPLQDPTTGAGIGTQSIHSYTLGAELGYGFKVLRFLTIRPQLGIGSYAYHSCAPLSVNGAVAPAQCDTESNLYFEPGVTALASLGALFAGIDVNALILTGVASTDADGNQASTTEAAFTAHAQVGVRF